MFNELYEGNLCYKEFHHQIGLISIKYLLQVLVEKNFFQEICTAYVIIVEMFLSKNGSEVLS